MKTQLEPYFLVSVYFLDCDFLARENLRLVNLKISLSSIIYSLKLVLAHLKLICCAYLLKLNKLSNKPQVFTFLIREKQITQQDVRELTHTEHRKLVKRQ